MTIPTTVDNASLTGLDLETLKTVGVKSVEFPNNFVKTIFMAFYSRCNA